MRTPHIHGIPPTDDTPSNLCILAVVILQEKEYEREDISNLTKARSGGDGGVSATWRGQNGIAKPSWTDSGGQDGSSGGQIKPKEAPEEGAHS